MELRRGVGAVNAAGWDNREPALGGIYGYNTHLNVCKASALPTVTLQNPILGPKFYSNF